MIMNKGIWICFIVATALIFSANCLFGQDEKEEEENAGPLSPSTFSGLKFRSIGPAFMSGRIADIAIHPEKPATWYVAVGSGGVWKTTNAGTTWAPQFDSQPSYSTGCVTIDPGNPNVVWVGTGENVGGRHVGYGDGVYRSEDGGKSWKNMGLKETQHISRILIHPDNSGIMWVAAQGPLWNKGGERGLYKTKDGGKTWYKVLGDDEWTGVTEVVMDPRDPDVLYAATWQRHRNVATYMGGGPLSGIHRSYDGGETWVKLENGLPASNMGKIGLAVSPQKPDVIYAAIELDRRTGGVFRSIDRGASWEKMSGTVSGATGPHYYQELYACPHNFDRIYLMDMRIQVSDDGGRTFRRLREDDKHSDNHTIAFRKDDPEYLLIGTDGGIYESYDLAESWRFINNLPITQYYKVAVDDREPFYNVYGGTQDNGTQGGPSRTDNVHGILNSDWSIVLYADGHQPATEPGNPDIMYAEWQQGNLVRIDLTTGEIIDIKPQPEEGSDYERFNWDSPILVSPHSPTTLFFGSQRVWRSDDRGDSWKTISPDLTRNQERLELPIMGKTWSWDSPWDMYAMSDYNTITSLAESPVQKGLIYAGTDDGLIQVTKDGGQNWTKLEVGDIHGVPETAFVNDIKADLFDAGTVYVLLDNHKFGELEPYILKSTNMGKSWESIRGNLPGRTLVWRIVQDHIRKDLFFLATEFGIYFTMDGGSKWIRMEGGLPTISFRDLAIQRRENDLVCASFGRSFYILDDYSPLRSISEEQLNEEATLFPVKDAWWYPLRMKLGGGDKGSQGAGLFSAPNPLYGAVFTYYLKDTYKTKQDLRKAEEEKLAKQNADIPFPGWEALEAEKRQESPGIWLTIKDQDGQVIRKISGPASKGIQRVAWDFRAGANNAIDLGANYPPTDELSGMLMPPGTYQVEMSKEIDGIVTPLSGPVSFQVKQMREGALKGSTREEIATYRQEVEELQQAVSALAITINHAERKIDAMRVALSRTAVVPGSLERELHDLNQQILEMDEQLNGNRIMEEVGENSPPTVMSRLGIAGKGVSGMLYGPTVTQKENLGYARNAYRDIRAKVIDIVDNRIPVMEKQLVAAGAPWIEGQPLPEK
jgi:photosystem II stability/assembly factor-like uncharacterized protein